MNHSWLVGALSIAAVVLGMLAAGGIEHLDWWLANRSRQQRRARVHDFDPTALLRTRLASSARERS